MMTTIQTENAPKAIGPYSQGKIAGNLIFLSGQIPLDPQTGEVSGQTIAEQTERIAKNIGGLLAAAGASFEQVVKTTCFLYDMADFAEFNRVYAQYFVSSPARSRVAVKALPKGVLAEIELIAVK